MSNIQENSVKGKYVDTFPKNVDISKCQIFEILKCAWEQFPHIKKVGNIKNRKNLNFWEIAYRVAVAVVPLGVAPVSCDTEPLGNTLFTGGLLTEGPGYY